MNTSAAKQNDLHDRLLAAAERAETLGKDAPAVRRDWYTQTAQLHREAAAALPRNAADSAPSEPVTWIDPLGREPGDVLIETAPGGREWRVHGVERAKGISGRFSADYNVTRAHREGEIRDVARWMNSSFFQVN